MRVLGIETSCDETAAAVVENGSTVLSSVVASQIPVHARFGGVVPEVASRQHLERLWPTVEAALKEADMTAKEVDGVAVTYGPGLVGALMVGVAFAKSMAYGLGKPLVGVNHLIGHIYAAFLGEKPVYPSLALIVSGGHTDIALVEGPQRVHVLGRSRDDAAGEALDKVARELGLGYPGGPALERFAEHASAARVVLPRVAALGLDFSFSGLKTAAVRLLKDGAEPHALAASFQEAVVDILCTRVLDAARQTGITSIVLAGGVSANTLLRRRLREEAGACALTLRVAERAYCTDNAAMIAAAGYYLHESGFESGWDLDAKPVIHPYKP